ncbi:hypothetical protein EON65_25525 [archaeon]|nr:MAG: hypothetical protein EON65_25525 [archaeon]
MQGEVKAGAYHTSKYRPWIHVVVVAGFPNKILALQFEWIWQHPDKSRVLKTVRRTKYGQEADSKKKLNGYKPKLKLLQAMLSLPVWQQLNLTVYVPDKQLQAFVTDLLKGNTNITVICENVVCDPQSNVASSRKRKAAPEDPLAAVVHCSFCTKQLVAKDKYYVCHHCSRSMHIYCLGSKSLEVFSGGEENMLMIPRLAECGHCHALCQWKHVIQKANEVADIGASATQTEKVTVSEQEVEDTNEDEDDDRSVQSEASQSIETQEEADGDEEEDFDVIIIDH